MKLSDLLRPGGLASLVAVAGLSFALLSYGVTREVPVGRVVGTVTQADGKTPLVNAEIRAEQALPESASPEAVAASFSTRSDAKGAFTFRTLPAGNYRFFATGKAHATKEGQLPKPVVEGKSLTVALDTIRTEVSLQLSASSRVFTPDESITIQSSGSTPDTQIKLNLSRIKEEAYTAGPSLQAFLGSVISGRNKKNPVELATVEKVFDRTEALTAKDLEGVFVQKIELGKLPRGGYLLSVSTPKETSYLWLTVTDFALVSKSAGEDIEALAVDLLTGEPVPGVSVSFVSGGKSQEVGATDQQGLVKKSVALPQGDDDDDRYAVLVARKGESRAYTYFRPRSSDSNGRTVSTVQTDRPIYRPGDTVFFKATFRNRQGSNLSVIPPTPIVATLKDFDDTEFGRVTLTTDSFGQVWGSFKTDDTMTSEGATLRLEGENIADGHYVSFASYRKPELDVKVESDRRVALVGERVPVKVIVTRYTGEVVPGMDVQASITKATTWRGNPFEDGEFAFSGEDSEGDGEYGYGGAVVESIQTKTNDQGEATIWVDTNKYTQEEKGKSDFQFSVQVNVSDPSGRSSEGRGSFDALRSETSLGTEFDVSFVNPNETAKLSLSTRNSRTGATVGDVTATVQVFRQFFQGKRISEERISQQTVAIGPDGKGSLDLKPANAGDYIIRTTIVGKDGRRVENEDYLWVPGETTLVSTRRGPGLKMTLNKPRYSPGDVAEVVLQTNKPGGVVWFTIEGDGIIESRIIPMTKATQTIKIDRLERFAPSIEISAVIVKEKVFDIWSSELRVGLDEKKLNVELTPNSPEARPGQTISYRVKTTDGKGNPVAAAIGLGVVDESIYAIEKDRADPLRDLHSGQGRNVTTSYSFAEIYFDGEDKSSKTVDIRTDFRDTAFWKPDVVTNAQGEAEVAVKLPDNLTSWRATASAITANSLVGRAVTNVIAKKPVMVRLSLPMVFVEDDEQGVTATVQNGTKEAQTVKLTLTAEGATISESPTIDLSIPAGEGKSHTFPIKVSRGESAKFTVTAVAGTESDGMSKTIPVLVRGLSTQAEGAGVTQAGETNEADVKFRPGAVRKSLTVTVAPSQLGTLIASLPYLVDYPYGCLEQTMSRFVPAVLVRDVMRSAGMSDPTLEKKIQDVEKLSMAKVRRMQRPDGGWGWFDSGESTPHMTAIALEGLVMARSAGVPVPDRMIADGVKSAKEMLGRANPADWSAMTELPRLAMATMMASGPDPIAIRVLDQGSTRRAIPNSKDFIEPDHVTLLLGYTYAGDAARPQRDREMEKVLADIQEEGDFAYARPTWWGSSTGRALQALVLVDPANPLIPKLNRTLFTKRRGNNWGDTASTSEVLMAAITQLRTTNEIASASTAEVLLNGQVVGRAEFRPGDFQPVTISVAVDSLKDENKLEVRNVGAGLAYWSFFQQESLYEEQSAPTPVATKANEFSITRTNHRLATQKLEDGTLRLLPEKSARTEFLSGEVYLVRVTLDAKKPLSFAAVEVPVASHCIITTSTDVQTNESAYWWTSMTIRDDKAVFFVQNLPVGQHFFEFTVRAEVPGKSIALPAKAYPMYAPAEIASTGQDLITVRGR